jgi:hypothetical protein
MRALAILSLSLCLFAPGVHASGSKPEKTTLTFHLEVDQSEGSKFVFPQNVAGETRYFSTSPSLGTDDIAAVQPFPEADGMSYGATVKLTQRGAGRLSALSGANVGRLLLVFINGRLVNALRVDQMINDGTIVVWSGISEQDVAALNKVFPRVGESAADWKKRLKSE